MRRCHLTTLSRRDAALALPLRRRGSAEVSTADFARVRALRVNRVVQHRDMPPALAERAFAGLVYRDHPYGHLSMGNGPALRAMGVDDVGGFYRDAIGRLRDARPGRRCQPRRPRQSAGDAFSEWSERSICHPGQAGDFRPRSHRRCRPGPWSTRLALLHRTGASQSELRIGHVAVSRDTPDYHALVVLNTVLGGQFVSRVNMNLREDKGVTYGARRSFDFRRGRGPFAFQPRRTRQPRWRRFARRSRSSRQSGARGPPPPANWTSRRRP